MPIMMRSSETNLASIIYFSIFAGRLSLDQYKQWLDAIARCMVPGMCYVREGAKRPIVTRPSVKLTIYACTSAYSSMPSARSDMLPIDVIARCTAPGMCCVKESRSRSR